MVSHFQPASDFAFVYATANKILRICMGICMYTCFSHPAHNWSGRLVRSSFREGCAREYVSPCICICVGMCICMLLHICMCISMCRCASVYEGGYLRTALRGGVIFWFPFINLVRIFKIMDRPQLFSKLRNSFCIWFFINIYSSVSSITYSIFSPKPGTSWFWR